jgi:phage terminase large subunit
MIEVNDLFKPAFSEDARVIDVLGGRGRGGSHFMAQHALIMLCTAPYYRAYFMRAIFKDVKTSLWKGFKDRFNEAVEQEMIDESDFVISDREMTIINRRNGNEIRPKGFRTSSGGQTANLKSLEGATTIYVEEAEEITEAQFTKLEDSLRTIKGKLQIFRAWNIPPKNHFLVKNYYNPVSVDLIDGEGLVHEGYFKLEPKGIPGHLMIFGTYHDNKRNIPKHKIDRWESYKFTNPEHYFTDILGYASGGAKGIIMKYNQNWFKWSELPEIDFYETYGLDFGGGGVSEGRKVYSEIYKFDEPDGSSTTVLVRLFINKASMRVYVKLLIYKAYISPSDLSGACKDHTITEDKEGYKKKKNVLADNARADKIRDLLNDGINCIGAKSKEGGSNKVVTGIDILKKYKIFFHVDDIPCHVDGNNYKWEVNKDGELTGNPVKKFENVWDAVRYGVVNYDLYNW